MYDKYQKHALLAHTLRLQYTYSCTYTTNLL